MLKEKREFPEEHRKHLSESHMGIKRTPEALAKFKESMKKRWADLEFKTKMIESFKGHFVSEETKRKLSKAHITISVEQEKQIIKFYASGLTFAEIKAELSIGEHVILSCLKRNNIERRRAGIRNGQIPWNKGIKYSEEQKAKLSLEGLKLGKAWNKGKVGIYSEEYLRKLRESHTGKLGPKSSNWQGGISFEPYSSKFNKYLKEQIRKRDDYVCQMPRCGKSENGRAHSIHHVDYDKKNVGRKNLITLCVNCNSRANGNRPHWEKLFKEIQIQKGVN